MKLIYSSLLGSRWNVASTIAKVSKRYLSVFAICGFLLGNGQSRSYGAPDLAITLSRTPETLDDTLSLQAIVKNVSRHDVTLGVQGPLIDYLLSVKDSAGRNVPLSKYGKEVFSKDRVNSSMYVMVTLHAGETRVDTWDITNLFAFRISGHYLVTVRRIYEPAHGSISSNVLNAFVGASKSK